MKFFVDSASIEEIREAAALGLLDGVTTNPSLVAKEGRPFAEVAREICQFVQGPVSLEVVSLQAKEMISEGKALRAEYGKNVVVKIPMTPEGLKATKALSSEGIPVNVTLVFSAAQALIAAKVGAYFVSPFVGRLDDIGHDGMDLIEDIVEIYDNYEFTTQVLVASTRGPMHIIQAAKLGADICTCPPAVIEALFKHPLTDIGLERFLKDWEKAQQK